MMKAPQLRKDLACEICGKTGHVIEIDSYKSTWLHCEDCGCYSRQQKSSYPLEKAATALSVVFDRVPKLNGLLRSLGRKPQGVDFYRYYTEQLASGNRGPWAGQSDMVTAELKSKGLLDDWRGKRVLEISGEPGFFAQDLKSAGADVIVSAFADDVARAMSDCLHVNTFTYDFNRDDIDQKVRGKSGSSGFDFIFIRFAIGFCTDVPKLAKDLSALLKDDGLLYISFSPASRAVVLRWMFDDYTYLRQYTERYLTDAATAAGLAPVARFDEGFFYWDRGPFSMHWSLRPFARRYYDATDYYRNGSADDAVQAKIALAYQKVPG